MLKQTFHLFLFCFRLKKCAKSHKQSQFISIFILTSVRDIFKQPDLMDRAILQGFWGIFRERFSERDSQKFSGLTSSQNNR